jgi:integrase
VSDSGDVPLEVLARLMGHTDVRTTRLYFEIKDKRALAAAKTIKLTASKAG